MVWLAVAIGMIGFAILAVAVTNDSLQAFDREVFLLFRVRGNPSEPLGPTWFEETVIELTALGGYPILVTVSVLVITALALMRKYAAVVFLSLALATGSLLSNGLKLFFDRTRPDLVEHLDRTFTSSFPSGHAMVSMVTWLTLAAVLVRFVPRRRLQYFVQIAAFFLALLIGVTRVYLGVHWPSDVLAGWSIGVAWAGICWLVAHYLTRRREQTGELGHSD